jgi:hypothetical protein
MSDRRLSDFSTVTPAVCKAENASRKPLPTISDLDADAQFQVEQSNNLKCFAWGRTALA